MAISIDLIDLPTFLIITVFLFAITSAFARFAFTIRKINFYIWLSLGCLAFSVGWLLFLGRFFLGINWITLPLANVLILALPILLRYAIRDFLNFRIVASFLRRDALILLAAFLFLDLVMDHPIWPALITSFLNAFYYSMAGVALSKGHYGHRTIPNTLIGSNFLVAVILLVRGIILSVGLVNPQLITTLWMKWLLYNALFINILTIHLQVLCFPLLDFMRTQITLEQQNQQLSHLANRDGLTGVFNRRSFDRRLQELLTHARDRGDSFSVVLFDIDFFKAVNDRFGHPVGDRVLVHVAHLAASQCRAQDFLARYGGEEFILLLPQTQPDEAIAIAERLRQSLETTPLRDADVPMPQRITASFGVAYGHPNLEVAQVLHRADQALYRSKQQGRNCVSVETHSCGTDCNSVGDWAWPC
jgi:diguanylate cyclase (GGDEF)-like protein